MVRNGLTHTREKIEKVLQIPAPERGKDLKSFHGVAVLLYDHIMNYAIIVHPLHLMLKNYSRERRLVWTQEGLDAFEAVKIAINNCSLLYFIDDVSPEPIAFVSKSLSEQEIRWSTIEKECYAIVYSCLLYTSPSPRD